jgi:hypothetical protein
MTARSDSEWKHSPKPPPLRDSFFRFPDPEEPNWTFLPWVKLI